MNREAHIWVKIVIHSLFLGKHFTVVMKDRVCLVYALMTGLELNIGIVLKSTMRKARVHKGCRYTFGGLITELCSHACVPTEEFDYCPHIEAPLYIVTNVQGLEIATGLILTIAEHCHRDVLIMARMYGLEMLRHRTGRRPSTQQELEEIEACYL